MAGRSYLITVFHRNMDISKYDNLNAQEALAKASELLEAMIKSSDQAILAVFVGTNRESYD